MRRIKYISYLLILVFSAVTCIKPFDPELSTSVQMKYVVSGGITGEEGYQTVHISVSSPVEYPDYLPLSGCQAIIFSNNDREYVLEETKPGQYQTWMTSQDLAPGTAYYLQVNTPSGDVLVSGYDTLPSGPPVDSVYYLLEQHLTSDPSAPDIGIQFYTDLNAGENQSRYYRWEVEETWEYHVSHAKEFYYDGSWHQIYPPDSSEMVCYSRNMVKNIYTLTTRNLAQNNYFRYPLHFVTGKTPRLGILYSVLVHQYALSEAAFTYYDQLRANTYELGGLYEKQPSDIKGNMQVSSGNGQEVLGFFFASHHTAKRLFVKDVAGLVMDFPEYCNEEPLGRFGWREFGPKDYPVYYFYNTFGGLRILGKECVECERMGGSLVKPDFWPE